MKLYKKASYTPFFHNNLFLFPHFKHKNPCICLITNTWIIILTHYNAHIFHNEILIIYKCKKYIIINRSKHFLRERRASKYG